MEDEARKSECTLQDPNRNSKWIPGQSPQFRPRLSLSGSESSPVQGRAGTTLPTNRTPRPSLPDIPNANNVVRQPFPPPQVIPTHEVSVRGRRHSTGLPGDVRFPAPARMGIRGNGPRPVANPATQHNDPYAWCKTIPCMYFANSVCILGSKCRFLHPELPADAPKGNTIRTPAGLGVKPERSPRISRPNFSELQQEDVNMDFADSR